MKKREEYLELIKSRLDTWNTEIHHLEEKIDQAEEGAKHRLQEQVESLKRHRAQAQEQVHRIEDAAEDVWHEIAKGAEEAWKKIGDMFAHPRSDK